LDLPAALVERLQAFMRHLGLVYGAIDMRRTPAGKYVFLEVNTAGEFLFIEERTGQPIGRAVADWLATFRRKNAVSEAALVRCGRNGVVFAIQFRPAQIDQA
jgi:glutathione synthase/RimK-type ligase-like ATP-grasp enzyme